MTRETDFLALYQELGLAPGRCSVDEFKYAYRRRVARLHPDRHPGSTAGAERMQRLTVLYDAALDFHRRYGRLPGAEQAAPLRYVTSGGRPTPPPTTTKSPHTRLRWVLFVLLVLFVLGWALSDLSEPELPPVSEAPAVPVARPAPAIIPATVPVATHIVLGMVSADVRQLQGAPVVESAEHWDYGPSWIQFSKGKVDDWYSSPLHPLKVDSERPGANLAAGGLH
ncbi:MAG: J domain-containing protein [Proteobacteria bacterium]|nr:J domain-containing protein [Pseudomonadota bacterium]